MSDDTQFRAEFGRFEKCSICGEYDWTRKHRCAPAWMVCPFEYLTYPDTVSWDWNTVYAHDAQDAAEKFVRHDDRSAAEFSEYAVVAVRKRADDNIRFFQVEGELVPEYTGTELSSRDAADDAYRRY